MLIVLKIYLGAIVFYRLIKYNCNKIIYLITTDRGTRIVTFPFKQ